LSNSDHKDKKIIADYRKKGREYAIFIIFCEENGEMFLVTKF